MNQDRNSMSKKDYWKPTVRSWAEALVVAGAMTLILAGCHHKSAEDYLAEGDAELSGSRTFAITSTVLTGAAVLGVGLGIALLLTTDGDGDAVGSTKPRFDVALGPSAAAASAAWSF